MERQTRAQIRSAHVQRLLDSREQQHAHFLAQAFGLLHALKASGLAEVGCLPAVDAVSAVNRISAEQWPTFYAAMSDAVIRGPQRSSRHAFIVAEAMSLCMIQAGQVAVTLGRGQLAGEERDALLDALAAAGDAWVAYAKQVQVDLSDDGA
jgi:hypothetical protein